MSRTPHPPILPRVRPMLYKGAMVNAMLREIAKPGSGKTETRRLAWVEHKGQMVRSSWADLEPGDLIWVRETVACGECAGNGPPSHWSPRFWRREQGSPANKSGLWYQADGLRPTTAITERGPWRPGIHMPRWVSRLTLVVTDVRPEPLQDISFAAAQREGIAMISKDDGRTWKYGIPDRDGLPGEDNFGWHWPKWEPTPVRAYARLWDQINGFGAWAANPEVIAIKFKPVAVNIDEYLRTRTKAA